MFYFYSEGKKLEISKTERVLVVLMLAFECNPTLATFNLGQYLVVGMLFGSMILRGLSKVFWGRFVTLLSLFSGWCVITTMWGISRESSVSSFLLLAKCLFLLFFLSNRKYDFRFYFLAYAIINFIDASILLPNIDLNALFTRGSRGTHIVFGVVWTTNTVCTMFAFSVFFLFVLFCLECEKRKKLVYVILSIPQIIDILLMGSRQALIIVVFSTILFYFFTNIRNHSGKKILVYLFLVALILGVSYLVMNNATLYQTIGRRFLGADQNSDSSRLQMIKLGIGFFMDRPIIGFGMGSFQVLNNYVAFYSHNNYVELLVSFGIVGFVLYHAIVFCPIWFVYKNKKSLTTSSIALVISLVIMILFSEMVIVTYLLFQYYFILFNACSLSVKDNLK